MCTEGHRRNPKATSNLYLLLSRCNHIFLSLFSLLLHLHFVSIISFLEATYPLFSNNSRVTNVTKIFGHFRVILEEETCIFQIKDWNIKSDKMKLYFKLIVSAVVSSSAIVSGIYFDVHSKNKLPRISIIFLTWMKGEIVFPCIGLVKKYSTHNDENINYYLSIEKSGEIVVDGLEFRNLGAFV